MHKKVKNVIFDVGNVLLTFRPYEFMIGKGYSEEMARAIEKALFKSDEWKKMDRGDLSDNQVLSIACRKEPDLECELKKAMDTWPQMLRPIPQSIQFYNKLKQKGFRLFILSNFPECLYGRTPVQIEQVFAQAEGVLLSFQLKIAKPEPEIYRRLLDTYGLIAEESVFFDDLEENIDGAIKMGIQGVLFQSPLQAVQTFNQISGEAITLE